MDHQSPVNKNDKIGTTAVCCFSTNRGGMELSAFDLSKLLSDLGTVVLVCRTNSFIHREAKNYGVTCETIDIDFKGNFSFRLIKEFKRLIALRKIKNVVFLGASELKSLFFSCLGQKINFINHHGTTKTHSKKDPLHRIFYSIVNTHVSVSDHIRANVNRIIPMLATTQSITIYPSKEVTTAQLNKSKGTVNCLLVGRIAGGKGHLDAITSCEAALKAGLDVTLTFVGHNEDKRLSELIKNRIEHSALKPKFRWLDHLSDLSEVYGMAHVLLFPSSGEGFGLVLLEAFQHRLLPITYDNTVFPEFLKLGFKFPQSSDQDVTKLTETLKTTISNFAEFEDDIEHNFELAKLVFSAEYIRNKYRSILR